MYASPISAGIPMIRKISARGDKTIDSDRWVVRGAGLRPAPRSYAPSVLGQNGVVELQVRADVEGLGARVLVGAGDTVPGHDVLGLEVDRQRHHQVGVDLLDLLVESGPGVLVLLDRSLVEEVDELGGLIVDRLTLGRGHHRAETAVEH